jgi:hypothetical protein
MSEPTQRIEAQQIEAGVSAHRMDATAEFGGRADVAIGAAGIRQSVNDGAVGRRDGAKTSLALSNLRAFVIVTVLASHSVLAYLGSLGTAAFAFDDPPINGEPFPSSTANAGSGSMCSAPGRTST